MAAITDHSTSELRVNLRARREWAQTAIGWRRRDALREIREMEDELEARGEPPEPEPPERAKAPQPTGYYMLQRLKMHTVDTAPDDDPQLCYHEDRGDGLPLCGQPVNPWTDDSVLRRSSGRRRAPAWWIRRVPEQAEPGRSARAAGGTAGRLGAHRVWRCVAMNRSRHWTGSPARSSDGTEHGVADRLRR